MPVQLLNPAVSFFNKLPFRYKIITIISILFTLLILPSFTMVRDFYTQNQIYQKQFDALTSIHNRHHLITLIQLHRGLINAYVHGDHQFRPQIQKSEADIQRVLDTLQKQDTLLSLSTIEKEFEDIKLDNISKQTFFYDIFNAHNHIIRQLITQIQKISEANKFGSSNDTQLNHLSKIITENLLLIQEQTGQLRGLTTGMLLQKQNSYQEKSDLLSNYTQIKSLVQKPSNIIFRENIAQYDPELARQKDIMLHKLNKLLFIVRKNLLLGDKGDFSPQQFFTLATETIDAQAKLYDTIIDRYRQKLSRLQNALYKQIALLLGVFMAILLSALYLSASFYHSVLSSIQKLQDASNKIAKGQTRIHLVPDTKDEIAEALIAFNRMSRKLDNNISFLNSYKRAIDHANIVSKTDTRGIITYVNDTFCQISGYTREELIGKPHNIVRHPQMPKEVFKQMWEQIRQGKIWQGRVKNRTKSGGEYIVDALIMPIVDHNNRIVEYIGIRHDVTELEKSREKIQLEMRKQKIDPLTQLPNRIQLLEDLRDVKQPVILYLNIDHFSSLNDFYGTQKGDLVLQYVASLLCEKLKDDDVSIYRLQADEFLILMQADKIKTDIESYLCNLIEYIEKETKLSDPNLCVSITLTGSIVTYHASREYEDLLTYATTAHKIAQLENKKIIRYNEKRNQQEDYQHNIDWINKIKEALEEDRIVSYFQPIIDNHTAKITKYESLVRLVEKDGRVISPYFFLDIAKRAKLYTRITKTVFTQTFATFEKEKDLEFSINITVEDIEDHEIAEFILDKIKAFAQPHRIILELTETEQIQDYTIVNQFIKRAKQHGVQIAIDDFGSGYSNFAHIIGLHADYIKIDGSLIKNIDTHEESRIITEAIIAFSKKLGAKTVVEFVHNEAVYQKTKAMGADFSQGFYLGEPSPTLSGRALECKTPENAAL